LPYVALKDCVALFFEVYRDVFPLMTREGWWVPR